MTPQARSLGFIRQWEILRLLEERPRSLGELVAKAGDRTVTSRTIRRDLDALQAARFALSNWRDDDGVTRWRLLTKGVTPARYLAYAPIETMGDAQ
jgi:hypothetical protein